MGFVHGGRYHPLYATWCNIKARCLNPSHPAYKNYGGRGITVCDAWRDSFADFLLDVGMKPSKGMTLDRIDNDKGYEPGNVRWANRVTQRRNSRQTFQVTIDGVTKGINDWCKVYNINISSVHYRMRQGEDVVSALTRPKMSRFARID